METEKCAKIACPMCEKVIAIPLSTEAYETHLYGCVQGTFYCMYCGQQLEVVGDVGVVDIISALPVQEINGIIAKPRDTVEPIRMQASRIDAGLSQ